MPVLAAACYVRGIDKRPRPLENRTDTTLDGVEDAARTGSAGVDAGRCRPPRDSFAVNGVEGPCRQNHLAIMTDPVMLLCAALPQS